MYRKQRQEKRRAEVVCALQGCHLFFTIENYFLLLFCLSITGNFLNGGRAIPNETAFSNIKFSGTFYIFDPLSSLLYAEK